ncbi:MAG: hypothetical protein ABTQ27_18080 [Amaricoccus sp.]|uniref:hypothetical protein n=1 Tax=Amaricoccus sp. TaxID=1872485 RepID=UPI003314627B
MTRLTLPLRFADAVGSGPPTPVSVAFGAAGGAASVRGTSAKSDRGASMSFGIARVSVSAVDGSLTERFGQGLDIAQVKYEIKMTERFGQ